MGSIMLAFIAAYITATYIFTHHMEGEAVRINLAGRYVTYVSILMNSLVSQNLSCRMSFQVRCVRRLDKKDVL